MREKTVTYLGWGGTTESRPATTDLGLGTRRPSPDHGLRRALFDIAFGYVNGFPASAITYYVLTRSLNPHIERWAMRREGITFEDGLPVARVSNR